MTKTELIKLLRANGFTGKTNTLYRHHAATAHPPKSAYSIYINIDPVTKRVSAKQTRYKKPRELLSYITNGDEKYGEFAARFSRAKNPVGLTRSQKVVAAMKLFEKFHVDAPQYVDEIDVPPPDVCVAIGTCDGILYTTVREGETEHYVHEFNEQSKPVLASSYDGKQLFIIDGKYDFTERGIIDKG